MLDKVILGASYLGIGGSFVGSKLQISPEDIHAMRVDRDTICEIHVKLPLVLAHGIEWIGQGNFTEYHIKRGVDSFARECGPTRKKPFAYSCFNVTSAYFTFKHFTPTKEYACQASDLCEVNLKRSHFSGRRPNFKRSQANSGLNNSVENVKFWYVGPAKALAWSKQILLKRAGVREYFSYNSFTPGLAENYTVISETALSNGRTDTFYGVDITSL